MFVAPRVPSGSGGAQQSDQASGAGQIVRNFVNTANDLSDKIDEDHGPYSSYIKDQFLLTCSDDGTVHLYDFSPFSRVVDSQGASQGRSSSSNQRPELEEVRMRRSGRRLVAEQGAASQ